MKVNWTSFSVPMTPWAKQPWPGCKSYPSWRWHPDQTTWICPSTWCERPMQSLWPSLCAVFYWRSQYLLKSFIFMFMIILASSTHVATTFIPMWTVLKEAWTVQIDGQDDTTDLCHSPFLKSSDNYGAMCETLVHHHYLLQPLGSPITEFSCLQEFLSIFIDIIHGECICSFSDPLIDNISMLVHECLVNECRILHHDVSLNNALKYACFIPWCTITEDEKKCECIIADWCFHCGLLIDFDYALLLDLEHTEVSPSERMVCFLSFWHLYLSSLMMLTTGNHPLHGNQYVDPVHERFRKHCPITCSWPRIAHLHICLDLCHLFLPGPSPFWYLTPTNLCEGLDLHQDPTRCWHPL